MEITKKDRELFWEALFTYTLKTTNEYNARQRVGSKKSAGTDAFYDDSIRILKKAWIEKALEKIPEGWEEVTMLLPRDEVKKLASLASRLDTTMSKAFRATIHISAKHPEELAEILKVKNKQRKG